MRHDVRHRLGHRAARGRDHGVLTLLVLAAVLGAAGAARVVAQPHPHPGLVWIRAGDTVPGNDVRAWDARVDGLVRTRELVLVSVFDDPDLPTRRHEYFRQYHQGVPVRGGHLTRQTDRGVTVSLFGTWYREIGLDVSTRPVPSASVGLARLEAVSGAAPVARTPPTLTVLPTAAGGYALAFHATMRTGRTVFVDAYTGQLLATVNEIVSQAVVGRGDGALGDAKKVSANEVAGVFRAHDMLRPAEIVTLDTRGRIEALDRLVEDHVWFDADVASDPDNRWTHAGVVDAHVHTGWTYDYFFLRHQWTGLDGGNGRIFSVVNAFDVFPGNAFFAPPPFGPEGRGVLGYGATALRMPLTTLDIVGHEFMHGVTEFAVARRAGEGLQSMPLFDGLGPDRITRDGVTTSCDDAVFDRGDGEPLPFLCQDGRFVLFGNQSGSLNEALSDIFGSAVEFFIQEPGSGPLRADYLLGEDLGAPARSVRQPGSLDIAGLLPYPDHYDRRLRFPAAIVEEDPDGFLLDLAPLLFIDEAGEVLTLPSANGGGVHWNSTILSHVFYLAVEGGRHATSGLSVAGVGAANREQIEDVFFRVVTLLIPAVVDFPLAGAAILQAAHDIGSPAVVRAVDEALRAVGL